MRKNQDTRISRVVRQAAMEAMEQRLLFTAAPISLDPSFGAGGVSTQLLGQAGLSSLTACNPTNGNVFVIGSSESSQGDGGPYEMEEFTATGALVTSFGNNGLATSALQLVGSSAAVQSDGKLLVMAERNTGPTTQSLYLTRYTAAGVADMSFGTGGTLEYSTGDSAFGATDSFDILPDGNIALTGSFTLGSSTLSAVRVYTSAGTLDTSFGTNGVAVGAAGSIFSLTVNSTGELLALGRTAATVASPPGALTAGLIERFTSTGKLDASFGKNGSIIAPNASIFLAASITSAGIAVSGSLSTSTTPLLELNHYTATGQINASFGSGAGYLSVNLPLDVNISEFQPDGKLLVPDNEGLNGIARLNADGTLDKTFGSGGYFNADDVVVTGLSLAPDGQIVLPSTTYQSADFDPIRLLANGSLDTSFGPGGQALGRPLFLSGDAIAALPGGQTLVAGEMYIANQDSVFIERFNANGSLDASFAPGEGYRGANGYIYAGPLAISPPVPNTNVAGLAVDASGRIYLDETSVGIVRYLSNGQLDKTFGINGIYSNSNASGFLLEANGQVLISDAEGLTRLNSNGQIDKTFGTVGTATLPSAFNQAGGVLATQSNGEILVGGSTYVSVMESTDLALVRLTSSGTVDTSFGTAGMAVADSLPEESEAAMGYDYISNASALSILPNGTIVLAGTGGTYYHGGETDGPTLAEFLQTGKPNTAFGTGGQTFGFDSEGAEQSLAPSLIVRGDGSLVVATTEGLAHAPFNSSYTPSFLVVRYDADGTVDTSRNDQFAPPDAGMGPTSQPYSVLSQAIAEPDGTILAVGSVVSLDGGPQGPVLTKYVTGAMALTGKPIGTAGSYQNKGNTIANVFDGNLSTFFDAPTASGSFAGLDLGSPKIITQISYAPRSGFASRMVGGLFQASNSATFSSGNVTLYAITVTPPAGVLTTVAVTNSSAYRYVRYVGPTNSYCNIAEAQFAGTTSLISQIGTVGSYNNLGNALSNAFDGKMSTFFDAPTASYSWVGLNFGYAVSITQVTFAPRAGFANRMVGGEIQASNTADFSSGIVTAYTISQPPAANVLTTVSFASIGSYQYWRYIGPNGGYCNISELAFNGIQ